MIATAAVHAAPPSSSRLGDRRTPGHDAPGPDPRHTEPRPAAPGVGLLGTLLAVLLMVATALVGTAPLRPPAVPPDGTVAGFSLERAREDLAVVAAVPHPMGSPEQARVEAYLVEQLTGMGLDPRVEGPVGRRQSLLMVAAYFGIGHFYGVPYGLLGVVLAFALGWLLARSMLETRGLFWAWVIHCVQDVLIFSFLAVGSVSPGG